MTRGRKPIPTQLKIHRGTLEKSRLLNNEYSPEVLNIAPEPTFLTTEYELQEYNSVTTQLIKDGLISKIDTSLIEAYCVEMAKYRQAKEIITKEGAVSVGKFGTFVNPWHLIMERSLDRALKIGVMFGLTPSARTKVSANKPKKTGLKEMLKDGTNE
jgi:P27 family predicted phage terminase small subunit